MRYALVLLLAGCVTPTVPSYIPAISVAAGVAATTDDITPTPTPEPSDECENCGGLGYVGDGTIRVDCPECDVDWQQVSAVIPDNTQRIIELLERMDARIATLEKRVTDLEDVLLDQIVPDVTEKPALTTDQCLEVIAEHQEAVFAFWVQQPEGVTMLEATELWLAEHPEHDPRITKPAAAEVPPIPSKSDEDVGLPSAGDLTPSPDAAAAAPPQPPAVASGLHNSIQWVTTDEARESGKPVWLHFTGSRCGPCATQAATVFTDPQVIAASQDWACVKIVDRHPWLGHYNLRMWPSDVFVTDEGAEVQENTGSADVADFIFWLNH